jgi:hypothetical protein
MTADTENSQVYMAWLLSDGWKRVCRDRFSEPTSQGATLFANLDERLSLGLVMTDAAEILKSGAVDKAADLLHKLAGPMFDEFGAILADKVRVYRATNLVSTVQKTERILREAGLPVDAVPTRLLLPIMEASSVENTETLQEMWAGLLATASQQTDSVSPSFIETLKQLTPDEARHLEVVCQETLKFLNKERLTDGTELVLWAFGARSYVGPKEFDVPANVYPDMYERLGLIRRNFKVNTYYDDGYREKVSSEVDGWYEFTEYAIRFLDACHGPLPARTI